jgi:hypothetical protein
MRVKTPVAETRFTEEAIRPAVERLKEDPALADFLAFAVSHGADRLLFPGRLAKVMRGEPPTAYIVALLLEWMRKSASQ